MYLSENALPANALLNDEYRMQKMAGERSNRLQEYTSAGAISVRPKHNPADELSRLRVLVASSQEKLHSCRAQLSDSLADNRRLEAALQGLQAENASLRAEVLALRPEVKFGAVIDDTRVRPASLPTAVEEVTRRVLSQRQPESQPPASVAALVQSWSLEALLSSATSPLACHVAHAVLRPLRAAAVGSSPSAGAAGCAALERAYCAELCGRGGRAALLSLLRESPLLETLATDLHEQLQPLVQAAAPSAATASPRPRPLPLKCVVPPPDLVSTVHVRWRLGGRSSDLLRAKFVRAVAQRVQLADECVKLKQPQPEPAGRSFVIEAAISASDGAATAAAHALNVLTPPLPGTPEAAEMAEAAARVGMSAAEATELAWQQARQATEELSAALGVKVLEPPAISLSRHVPSASLAGASAYHAGVVGLLGPPHAALSASTWDPQADAAAMELLRAEHCSRPDSMLPFSSAACQGIHTSAEIVRCLPARPPDLKERARKRWHAHGTPAAVAHTRVRGTPTFGLSSRRSSGWSWTRWACGRRSACATLALCAEASGQWESPRPHQVSPVGAACPPAELACRLR